jgi:hypothetical protein
MKERPILFSTKMVQAILEGRKTMTRRAAKPRHKASLLNGMWTDSYILDPKNSGWLMKYCPYGQPGDVLWVRETWHPKRHSFPIGSPYEYKATAEKDGTPINEKWKPALFMPKAACRLFLKITNIRVERLQDISEADAVNEGIESWVEERLTTKPTRYKCYFDFDNPKDPATYCSNPVDSFQSLWQSINGKESWDANPWVWVISFEKL